MLHDAPDTAAAAFARADWEALLPKLLARARRILSKLGWDEGKARRSGLLEERELVNEAIEACLTGARAWVAGTGATEASLVTYLDVTMRSIAVNKRTSSDVAQVERAEKKLVKRADGRPTPERLLAARELLGAVDAAFEGDDDATAVRGALADGHVYGEELAATLGWSESRMWVVRRRMKRRLEKQGVTLYDESETS
jgi:hypothetical protein